MGALWIGLVCLVVVVMVMVVRRRASPARSDQPPPVQERPAYARPAGGMDSPLSDAELEDARAVAAALTEIVDRIGSELRAGTTTHELDARIEAEIVSRRLLPAMKGFNGAPAASMISVGDEVLHAVPSRDRKLRDGDLVTIQTAVRGRVHASIGRTYVVGAPSERARRLLAATDAALERAIDAARVGNRIGDIGFAIQSEVERAGLSVVREYVGYAIGRSLIAPPQVPGCGQPQTGMRLRERMLLNLHVIAKEGPSAVSLDRDGWTVRGAPGELSSLATAMVWLERDRTEVLTPLGA